MANSVKTGNGMTEYFSFGSGNRPLVILPGLGLQSIIRSKKSIESAYGRFADDYTVWVFDRVDPMPKDYSIRQIADDTAEAMQKLDISEANVFGASLGGMIAQTLAVYHPGLVRSLILGSTLARSNETARTLAHLWAAAAEARDGNALCEMMLPKLYTAPLAEKLSEAAELMLAGVTDGDYDRFVTQAKAIAEFDIYDKLDQIRVPALVIGVENDLVVTGEASLEIAEKLGCDCHMYGSEYAHCVFDEDPGYKQILLDQLESTYRQHRTIQGARLACKS